MENKKKSTSLRIFYAINSIDFSEMLLNYIEFVFEVTYGYKFSL